MQNLVNFTTDIMKQSTLGMVLLSSRTTKYNLVQYIKEEGVGISRDWYKQDSTMFTLTLDSE